MKKDIKAWAIKIAGRSFYNNNDGHPYLFRTRTIAPSASMRVGVLGDIKAEPVRVRVRIEEIE